MLIGRESKENSRANKFTKESDFLNLIPNSNKVYPNDFRNQLLLRASSFLRVVVCGSNLDGQLERDRDALFVQERAATLASYHP